MDDQNRSMSHPASWVLALSPSLFWDTDPRQIDPEKHLKAIVERVVERGTWADWQNLRSHVSTDQLRSLMPRLRVADRERAFLEAFLEASRAP